MMKVTQLLNTFFFLLKATTWVRPLREPKDGALGPPMLRGPEGELPAKDVGGKDIGGQEKGGLEGSCPPQADGPVQCAPRLLHFVSTVYWALSDWRGAGTHSPLGAWSRASIRCAAAR